MIDLIIGVDNVEEWHAHNLKLNPKVLMNHILSIIVG